MWFRQVRFIANKKLPPPFASAAREKKTTEHRCELADHKKRARFERRRGIADRNRFGGSRERLLGYAKARMTEKTARRSVDFTALPRSQRLRGKRRPPRVGDQFEWHGSRPRRARTPPANRRARRAAPWRHAARARRSRSTLGSSALRSAIYPFLVLRTLGLASSSALGKAAFLIIFSPRSTQQI